jgi:histidinol-phosphate aminotransferase
MSRLMSLIRPDLREFTSYSSARDEAKNGKIWLNANESPFPYLLGDGILLNRYPEKQPTTLLKRMASLYDVAENQLVLSRGSDEVIDLLIRLMCRAGFDSIMITPPTFGMYAVRQTARSKPT